jgi:hypothetical protein
LNTGCVVCDRSQGLATAAKPHALTHEVGTQIKALVANVCRGPQLIQTHAPNLNKPPRWFALVRYIVEQILACAPKPNLGLNALGNGQLTKIGC